MSNKKNGITSPFTKEKYSADAKNESRDFAWFERFWVQNAEKSGFWKMSVSLSVCDNPLYRSLILILFHQILDLSFFWVN